MDACPIEHPGFPDPSCSATGGASLSGKQPQVDSQAHQAIIDFVGFSARSDPQVTVSGVRMCRICKIDIIDIIDTIDIIDI